MTAATRAMNRRTLIRFRICGKQNFKRCATRFTPQTPGKSYTETGGLPFRRSLTPQQALVHFRQTGPPAEIVCSKWESAFACDRCASLPNMSNVRDDEQTA